MISKILAGGVVIAGLVGASAGAASAATTHPAAAPKVAVGSVELAGPLQYESAEITSPQERVPSAAQRV